jgi:hypothetical protein
MRDFVSVYKSKCQDFQVDARDVIINALELEQYALFDGF